MHVLSHRKSPRRKPRKDSQKAKAGAAASPALPTSSTSRHLWRAIEAEVFGVSEHQHREVGPEHSHGDMLRSILAPNGGFGDSLSQGIKLAADELAVLVGYANSSESCTSTLAHTGFAIEQRLRALAELADRIRADVDAYADRPVAS